MRNLAGRRTLSARFRSGKVGWEDGGTWLPIPADVDRVWRILKDCIPVSDADEETFYRRIIGKS